MVMRQAPKPRNYPLRADGTIGPDMPIPDAYYTLVTRVHGNDVPKSAAVSTVFYDGAETDIEVRGHALSIIREVNGRKQQSIIPLTEVVRLDINEPSQNFFDAVEIWSQENYNMTYMEYVRFREENQQKGMLDEVRRFLGDDG